MYGRAIKFVTNKNVHQSAIRLKATYPSYSFSSVSTHHNKKDSNFVDDIRKSASGLPPASSTSGEDRVNVVKTTTSTPLSDNHVNVANTSTSPSTSVPSSAYDRHEDDRDTSSFVADAAKQGVRKAMETGLDIGEMAKNTLDSVYNATRDTTHMVKEAVTGDDKKNNDVPPTDHFVDDLRKRADGYDLKNKHK